MAVTVSRYNNTVKGLLNSEIDLTDLAFMLLDDDAAALFDATDTDMSGLSGAEVDGNGWTSGGEDLENVAVTTITTNDAKIDADDISVTATGGPIGPALSGVIYEKGTLRPLWFYDFGQAETAGEDTDFKVIINASGISFTSDPA